MKWTADIATDPARDHKLHVELCENEEFRARLFRDEAGALQLRVYRGADTVIPVDWLIGIVQALSKDIE